MHSFLLAVKFSILASVGSLFSFWAAEAATQISGDMIVDIRTVVTVGGVVLLSTWRLSRWMQEIMDRLKIQDEHRRQIEIKISRLEGMLLRLPCVRNPETTSQCKEPNQKP